MSTSNATTVNTTNNAPKVSEAKRVSGELLAALKGETANIAAPAIKSALGMEAFLGKLNSAKVRMRAAREFGQLVLLYAPQEGEDSPVCVPVGFDTENTERCAFLPMKEAKKEYQGHALALAMQGIGLALFSVSHEDALVVCEATNVELLGAISGNPMTGLIPYPELVAKETAERESEKRARAAREAEARNASRVPAAEATGAEGGARAATGQKPVRRAVVTARRPKPKG